MLLWLTSVIMWVRSYWRMDRVFHDGGQVQQTLTSLRGRVQYFHRTGFPRGESHWYFDSPSIMPQWMIDSLPARPWYQRIGFDFVNRPLPGGPAGARDLIIMLPYWFVSALSVPLPALLVIRRVRLARRAKSGCCRHCGYDLRASKDRWPECGRAID